MNTDAHPGDTLLICLSDGITAEQADEIRRQLLRRLPGLSDVVLLPANHVMVYRPSGVDE
jgi:hypothetical protein